MAHAAIALKNHTLSSEIIEYRGSFEQRTGMTDWSEPEELIAQLKTPKR